MQPSLISCGPGRDVTPDEAVLSALLRGEETRWPYAGDAAPAAFLALVASHGLQPLIARQIRRGILLNAPASLVQPLARAAVQHAAIEGRLAAEVRRTVSALADDGVPALLLKGTALAYTHYPHPCLRPRTDTDLLIRPDGRAAAFARFEGLGYEALNMTAGDFVLHQRTYTRVDRLGVRHVYDLHWKIAGPQTVAEALRWDDLAGTAVTIGALGGQARAPDDAHALLLACLHRMAHHYDNPRLIWLYDIHLLASRLGDEAMRAFMPRCIEKGLAEMCIRSLALARERFGTQLPGEVDAHARVLADASRPVYHADVRPIEILAANLQALPSWRHRLRLLREHVFPPAAFIRRRYGVASPLALPGLYAHRLLTGVWKWLRPARRTDPFA
jgi:hypothetical protein